MNSTTLAARVAAHFRKQPNRWIDGRELAAIGGYAGWRSRVSDCRRSPHNLNIENRQRRARRSDGGVYTISEYRLILPEVVREATTREVEAASPPLF
jgi:hypothetical protein